VLSAPPAVSHRADERALFARHRRRPEPALRDALVARYLPLARQVAARYSRSHEAYDDVFQVAALALVKAVDRFDPDRGVAFASYAVPTVVGEVKRHFRDRTWAVHVTRDLQERSLRVGRAVTDLTARLGRSPSVEEIAASVGTCPDDVLEALDAAGAYRAASLDAPRPSDREPGVPLAETIGYDDERFAAVERRADLSSLLARLGPRDRAALWLRFECDLPPARLAALLGVREREAARVVRRAVERLRGLATDAL
jgi:RNA polymerase sigma-B factor